MDYVLFWKNGDHVFCRSLLCFGELYCPQLHSVIEMLLLTTYVIILLCHYSHVLLYTVMKLFTTFIIILTQLRERFATHFLYHYIKD